MKFQLVLQFAAKELSQFDELIALEEKLVESLPLNSEVDGHDFGSGEFNIFILTDQPHETFVAAQRLIDKPFLHELRAGFRECGKDSYFVLWPESLQEFRVI
jgi:hypothetical protein